MNRIESIYSLIDEKDMVVDVGCDQAKLSIMLAKRGQSSIASDVSINVINRAKNDVKSPLIDLRVSNGLENIKEGEADTLILAGMGTHTILEILSNTSLRFKKIITISNNYHDILRKQMLNLNYKVKNELIIKENNKYYNLILFEEGKQKYTEKELLLGLNHLDTNMYNEYLEYLLIKNKKIQISSNNTNINSNKIINYIENKKNE